MYKSFTSLVIMTSFLFVGCGKTNTKSDTHPVEGIVSLNSVPLKNIQVRFQPDPIKGGNGIGANGVTGADGKYTLKSDDGRDGAVAGWYIVSLTDLDAGRAEQGEKEKPSRIPEAVQSTNKSPIQLEVKPGSNLLHIDPK